MPNDKPPSLTERNTVASERAADALDELRDMMAGREHRDREQREEAERIERDQRSPGRREPSKPMWGLQMFKNWPVILTAFDRRVPDNFVALADRNCMEIACPCGETPTVTLGNVVTCQCERAFFYDGEDVRVAFSPEGARTVVPQTAADRPTSAAS